MKKIYSLTIAALVFVQVAVAQETVIKGRVLDKTTGEAAAFSNVMLMADTTSDANLITGAVSDLDGNFQLKTSVHKGALKIQSVGYLPLWVTTDIASLPTKNNVINLGDILLEQNQTVLNEVTVTALRKRYAMDGDKIVMNVDDGVTATSANVFEMLKKVPGVMVDNNENISLNGKSGILFQFNGRDMRMPADAMKSILKSIPANSVAKIETITNPSAKYEAEGTAGIINIVMGGSSAEGFSGTVSSWNGISDVFRTFNNASLQYVNDKWTLSANGGLGIFNSLMETEARQYLWQGADTTLMHLQPIAEHNKFRTGNINLSADYKIDSNNSAGATFSYNRNRTPIVEDDPSRVFHISRYPYSDVLSSYAFDNDQPSTDNNYMGNVYFNHRTDTLGSQLSVSFDFNHNSSRMASINSTRYYTGILDSLLRSESNTDSTLNHYSTYALKFDMVKQFSKNIGLEYGLKSRLSSVDNDFRSYADKDDPLLSPITNHLKYKENVNAAYVNLSHHVTDKLSYRAGLRFEHTYTYVEQLSNDMDTANNYFDLFPNVSLSYRLGDMHSLSLTYSYRITRPDYNSLNPFITKMNDFSFSSGNIGLLPEYSHQVDLNVSLFYMFFITASYGYVNNEINNITVAMPGSDNITIQKPFNTGYQQFASLSLSGMVPVGPVEWTFWMRGMYNQAKSDSPELLLNVERFSFMTWQSIAVKLPWELKLSANGFYMSGMYQQGMEMGDIYMFGGALTRKFLKNALQVSIGVNNIPQRKMKVEANYNNYRMQTSMMWDKPYLTLNLQYSFGKTASNNTLKKLRSDDMDDRKGEGGGIQQPGTGTVMGQ